MTICGAQSVLNPVKVGPSTGPHGFMQAPGDSEFCWYTACQQLQVSHHDHKFPQPKMFVEQVKFLACIRVQHTKHPSSERVTAHGVVPSCFFWVQGRRRSPSLDVTDRQSRSRCRCVGPWAGIRDTRLGKLGRADTRVCASLVLPGLGSHANRREEVRILVFR